MVSADLCEFGDSIVSRDLIQIRGNFSCDTQVGSDCDHQLEDCRLRLGGRLVDLDVVVHARVMFFQHSMFEGKIEWAYDFRFEG